MNMMNSPKLPSKCGNCGRSADEVKIHLSNYKCTDCMRLYNRQRYQARKAGTLVQTGPSRPRWGSRKLILDPSEEWVFEDEHWEEYDPNVHGSKVGAKVTYKDFE